ncbi:nucleoside kinase [Treponema bryantii]|uniref:nucleoside kinase n=1 Tax=Treponema bryantii TaxID=163 RepID=UPI002B2C2E98|nr:uridine kinase [Treponema bryantii]
MNDISITFIKDGNEITKKLVPYGTPVSVLTGNFGIPDREIYAVRISNEICPLDMPLTYDAILEAIPAKSKDGAAVYRRSLCLMLAAAAHNLFPKARLLVGHSLGYGYYYTLEGAKKITEKEIKQLTDEMKSLVEKDIPITTESIPYAKAAELFEKLNLVETRKQIKYNCPPTIKINTIGDFSDLYFGPLVLSTGVLKTFELMKYGEGFLLRFPKSSDPDKLTEFKDQPKLFEIYSKYKEWGKRMNVTSAASLNELIGSRKINDFIEITEIYQQKNISKIASQIVDRKTVRVVLIAGPSSSGKTTSAKKLALELQAMGYQPKVISLDCYYVGHDKTPLDADGKPDYECLEALNIELLNNQLVDLFNGKEITVPTYDFHTGTAYFEDKNKMTLKDNEILIMEGIHGLNDKLTPKVAPELKFKIYLSALTQLNLDDHNRISTSDNRLIRRIVRDNNFRGKPAAGTIEMWPSVRRGEELHIFPFQNNADAVLNTALDYELSVLRVYAAPLLRQVTPMQKEYAEARRLLQFLENFATISPSAVPPRSIIREFIGGSAFKY